MSLVPEKALKTRPVVVPLSALPDSLAFSAPPPEKALLDWVWSAGRILDPVQVVHVPGLDADDAASMRNPARFADGRRRVMAARQQAARAEAELGYITAGLEAQRTALAANEEKLTKLRAEGGSAAAIEACERVAAATAEHIERSEEQRTEMAERLESLSHIPVTVIESTEGITSSLTIMAHSTRRQNMAAELAAIETILRRYAAQGVPEKQIVSKIAADLHLSVGTVQQRLKLRGLIPALREALDAGAIRESLALAIAKKWTDKQGQAITAPQERLAAILREKGALTTVEVEEEKRASTAAAVTKMPLDDLFQTPGADQMGPPAPPAAAAWPGADQMEVGAVDPSADGDNGDGDEPGPATPPPPGAGVDPEAADSAFQRLEAELEAAQTAATEANQKLGRLEGAEASIPPATAYRKGGKVADPYPEMNERLVGDLQTFGRPITLYAAGRIEQLEDALIECLGLLHASAAMPVDTDAILEKLGEHRRGDVRY